MGDFNEEDYLDNLLNQMSKKEPDETEEEKEERLIKQQVANAVKKSVEEPIDEVIDYEEPDSVKSIDDLIPESTNAVDNVEKQIQEAALSAKQDNDDIQVATDEVKDEYKEYFESDNPDFDANNIDENEPESDLTPSEIERLASMDLDNIIEDVNSDGMSIEDLFNTDGIDEVTVDKTNSVDEKDSDTDVSNTDASNIDVSSADISNVDTSNTAASKDIETDAVDNIKDETQKELKQVEKKKKKGFLQILKNIFFEDIEEEVINESKEPPKDENERLLNEMYGGAKDDIEEEDTDVELKTSDDKPKGLIAKIKAFFNSKIEKHAIEGKAEEEAEEAEYNEKKAAREAKKAEAKEKKEASKAKKEEKPKKEKKPPKEKKEKKPKKEKQPPKPGDILKIKPKTIIKLVLFVSGTVILITVMNDYMHYMSNIQLSKTYYQNGNYEEAYDSLNGTNIKAADEDLYKQVRVLMYLDKQINSYDRYTKLNMKAEALDSLIKGVDRYNTYRDIAEGQGVVAQFDDIYSKILDNLLNSYGIDEAKANEYCNVMKEDFVQYHMTIETYK